MVPPPGLEPGFDDYKSPGLTFDLRGHKRANLSSQALKAVPLYFKHVAFMVRPAPISERWLCGISFPEPSAVAATGLVPPMGLEPT